VQIKAALDRARAFGSASAARFPESRFADVERAAELGALVDRAKRDGRARLAIRAARA
jgi:hypothetical protein